MRAFGRKGSGRKRPAVVEREAALVARRVDAEIGRASGVRGEVR